MIPLAACSIMALAVILERALMWWRLGRSRDPKVASSGQRDLRDPLYLTRAVLLSTDPLRYEKNLLLEWFQREFAGRPGRAPGSGGATK